MTAKPPEPIPIARVASDSYSWHPKTHRVIRTSADDGASKVALRGKTFPTYERAVVAVRSQFAAARTFVWLLDYALLVTDARARAGESQTEFATRIRIKVDTIRAWEQGRNNPRGLYRDRLHEVLRL